MRGARSASRLLARPLLELAHVLETDVRLLNKISHPSARRFRRAVTGWGPAVSFVELVVRLGREATPIPKTELAP